MFSIKTYLGATAIAALVMTAATPSAQAWTRYGRAVGPYGGVWSSGGTGGCSGNSCGHSSWVTGLHGRSVTNTGSTTCAGGTCTHTGATTGPYGGTINRSSTFTR
jgi:hypothetical protein